MAQDLRNQLLSIQGYADLLLAGDDKVYAEKIVSLAQNMNELLQRSVSLADAGLVAEKTAEVDLGQLVQTVAETIIPKNVTFSQDALPTILGDKEKLFKAFQNLFENAIAHGKPSRIEVRLESAAEGFNVLISNDGLPIPEEHRPKIFERRFTTKMERGGLGLAIVQKVIDAHDWEIYLEPIPETTFRILIPTDS